ncbi:hypothetical protein J4Q44_G00201920 [Coregonus suidteri]|uniref:Origin recognition complex subunit 1 n=1 Tax=Coregonus suidteri TaxID=861788 RepID=A0AAN8LFP2_9TELE
MYARMSKLTDQKATTDHAAALLENNFSNPAPKKETTVLLADELDLLLDQEAEHHGDQHTGPDQDVVLAVQLQQIITSGLNKVKAFEEEALHLVSKKVAALSGDIWRCLDTEICEHSASHLSSTGLVGMSHVMEALDEMSFSSYIKANRRLGLEVATFQQVLVQHQALCRVEGLYPLSVSEGLAVCQRLRACRLLLLEASRLDVLQQVSQNDVLYALNADRETTRGPGRGPPCVS